MRQNKAFICWCARVTLNERSATRGLLFRPPKNISHFWSNWHFDEEYSNS